MWFNPIIKWLLNSPFHRLISNNMMLIIYKGRKSGKTYSTPVNYLELVDTEGKYLAAMSLKGRVWWRNLREGTPVTVLFRGKNLQGVAEVIEDNQEVADFLSIYLQQFPQMAKYFQITLDENGDPISEEVIPAAKSRVAIKIRLN